MLDDMTVRDYLAGQAMQALINKLDMPLSLLPDMVGSVVGLSRQMADAMLKELYDHPPE